jgi:tRNA-2-methylthio-N6-dimethylallyladenosine synthase
MNKLDAELVRSVLADRGYAFADNADGAGVVLFLTCSVRQHAEDRVHSRLGALKALKKRSPGLVIGIMGCMAQEHANGLFDMHPHLDIVCGTRDFHSIADLVERVRSGERRVMAVETAERPRVHRDERLRPMRFKAFLAVMRGCDNYCSYCIVPSVRGREESRPADEIVEEARRLVVDGVKEITLLGQAVNRYDDGAGVRLPGLLRKLDGLPGLKRLHFVTSYPAYVDSALIDAIAGCRTVTRFLHVPAQSGSNRILRNMNRCYTAEDYIEMADRLREAVPDMELGSDFIVGFPGESEADFEATLDLMRRVRFQQSFIFKYSPRPGTAAARRFEDDVPDNVKRERNARLLHAQETISLEKNELRLGTEAEVLVEGPSRRDASRYTGRTVQNSIVAFPGSDDMVGRFARIRIANCTALTLIGDRVLEVKD